MSDLLTAVAILFIVAGPFLLLADRFDLPFVPLLIIAGSIAAFEPLGVLDEEGMVTLAQFGIALLAFSFGARIELASVRTVLVDSEIAALGQIAIVGSLGAGVALLLGIELEGAIVVAAAAALSSTIIAGSLLQSEIRMDLVRGRLAESIHFVQDLVAVLVLLVLGAEAFTAELIAQQLGFGVVLLVGALAVNRYLFDVVARLAGNSDELMIVGVVSLLVLFMGVASAFSISIVVGAFAAGLSIRYDPLEFLGLFNGLESLEDFFVAIFFLTLGALGTTLIIGLDDGAGIELLLLVGALVVLTAVVKPIVTTAILLRQGHNTRTAVLTSLSTDQVSEFALVIAIQAWVVDGATNGGLIASEVFAGIVVAATITMISSSLTRRYDERIYELLTTVGRLDIRDRRTDEWSNVPDSLEDHVVIIGYGRQGKLLADACKSVDQQFVVVENDPVRWSSVVKDCSSYVFGDAVEPYTMSYANIDAAKILVSTVDSEPVSRRLVELTGKTDVVVRSSNEETAMELHEAGALNVVVSDALAGERLIQYMKMLLEDGVSIETFREDRIQTLDDRGNEPVRND